MITSESWKTRKKGKGVYFSENKFSKFSTRLSKIGLFILRTPSSSLFQSNVGRVFKKKVEICS